MHELTSNFLIFYDHDFRVAEKLHQFKIPAPHTAANTDELIEKFFATSSDPRGLIFRDLHCISQTLRNGLCTDTLIVTVNIRLRWIRVQKSERVQFCNQRIRKKTVPNWGCCRIRRNASGNSFSKQISCTTDALQDGKQHIPRQMQEYKSKIPRNSFLKNTNIYKITR